jgi:Amino-terminal Zinc-binding domain of ubiquitin ligase E3A
LSENRTTTSNSTTTEVCGASLIVDEEETDEMKRTAAKKLIERYFYQLIDGCGNVKCNNKFCASSGHVEKLTPNQAAARAIQLFSQDAKLCDTHPSKQAKMHDATTLGNNDTTNSRFVLCVRSHFVLFVWKFCEFSLISCQVL